MYSKSTLPMDSVDINLLPDIIRHVLGETRSSADLIEGEAETVENGHNPAFNNDDAETIISDLTQVCNRVSDELEVSACTNYDPDTPEEANFLDLTVTGYVEMKRDYFEECHDPYR